MSRLDMRFVFESHNESCGKLRGGWVAVQAAAEVKVLSQAKA